MPFTIITLKKVPNSLRGDLTKWMQEIATGVYVGNFNTKIRENLWERVIQSASTGEATISYAYHNELGYQFQTFNTNREAIDYDGIPLVILPIDVKNDNYKDNYKKGYSDAAKFRKANKNFNRNSHFIELNHDYVVVDIETDGLDYEKDQIIEIGAVKVKKGELIYFHKLIEYKDKLPIEITELTKITQKLLEKSGQPLRDSLIELVSFIEDFDIVGYNIDFDLIFLNNNLKKFKLPKITNTTHDLIRYIKREKMLLKDYKLKTVLPSYGLDNNVPHRALEDAKIIYQLSTKVNNFLEFMDQK